MLPARCQTHVSLLDLSTRVSLFNVEIKTNKRESNRNRLRLRVGILSCIGIDDELMDEGRIAMSKCVGCKLVVAFLLVGCADHDGYPL